MSAGKGSYPVARMKNKKESSSFIVHQKAEKRANNFCRKRMKAFLEKPGKQSLKEFNKAYNKLVIVNPSQANAIMRYVKTEMFNRAIFEKDLQ